MKVARDLMDTNPPTVTRSMLVPELAEYLHQRNLDGVCVVDNGALVGIVTTMDLIFKEKRLHIPTVFWLLDMAIPLENPFRAQQEVDKITAATVGDLMTTEVVAVQPDTAIDRVAELMVDRHVSLIPVVDGGKLVGVVTKPGMLRAAFQLS